MSVQRVKLLMSALGVVGIMGAVLGGPAGCALAVICTAVMITVYMKNTAAIANISQDNPKVRTLRGVTIFTAAYAAAIVLLAVAANRGILDAFADKMGPKRFETAEKLLMAVLLGLPMAVYGNVAPKLPRSRHMGLRLPWTVRDEQTWIVAHRVLGLLSLPLTVLLFIPVGTGMGFETYVKLWWTPALLLWVGIPALASGVFYWRKYK